MATLQDAALLLDQTTEYHRSLIQQARSLDTFRGILAFLVECLEFAQKYLEPVIKRPWPDGPTLISQLSQQSQSVYLGGAVDANRQIQLLISSGSTVTTAAYAYLTNHYSYFEGTQPRSAFETLTYQYRTLLSGPSAQNTVQNFLGQLDETAGDKFAQAIRTQASVPMNEDAEGPLVSMRSAIEIAMRTLISRTPLTNAERHDLKKVAQLPAIAEHLAKDDSGKLELILANSQLIVLREQLSAAKDKPIPRPQADSLMYQATAILTVIADNIRLDQSPG